MISHSESKGWRADLGAPKAGIALPGRFSSKGSSCFRAVDGYGLRDTLPAGPALAPRIRFLFIGSHLCFALTSDLASRRQPLGITNPSPPSGWVEEFHLRAIEHARHTTNQLSREGWAVRSVRFRPGGPARGGVFWRSRSLDGKRVVHADEEPPLARAPHHRLPDEALPDEALHEFSPSRDAGHCGGQPGSATPPIAIEQDPPLPSQKKAPRGRRRGDWQAMI